MAATKILERTPHERCHQSSWPDIKIQNIKRIKKVAIKAITSLPPRG
jgi:hypothetical protein